MSKEKCGTKEEEVKKLILVGNGCDLAMGLPTRYQDFLLWLIKKYILETLKSKEGYKQSGPIKPGYTEKGYQKDFDEVVSVLIEFDNPEEVKRLDEKTKRISSWCEVKEFLSENKIKISASNSKEISKSFIRGLIYGCFQGWVDIEENYYSEFKRIIWENSLTDKRIQFLNNEMDHLTAKLEEYLKEVSRSEENAFSETVEHNMANQWRSHVYPLERRNNPGSDSADDDKIFIVNFNYTPTLISSPFDKMNHIGIHGTVSESGSSIVFGYGDEMDEKYSEIENLNKNEYLRKFKSFGYFQYSQYRQLLSIVNSGSFDVVIYGHSCGLSDRVLLNEIFEHKNCRYIRVYYYRDKNDYIDKTMNISRHFNSNQLMRQRVINFQEEDRIPQVNDSLW